MQEEKKLDVKKTSRARKHKPFTKKETSVVKDVKTYGASDNIPIYKKGPNDFNWRCRNALSTKLAASVPFYQPNGILKNVGRDGQSSVTFTTPGILVIRPLLTAGPASDYNSPVNLASRLKFSETRRHNSGSTNYEAVDQMMYFISMEQAYALCGWLQRLYRCLVKFTSLDRFQPRALVIAMQVDYDDVIKHQAELAWLIRWLGNALNSLSVPDITIFRAAYDAFRHIYTDDSSPRRQIYMLDPFNFGVYNPTYNSNGGGVDFDSGNSKQTTYGSGNLLTYANLVTMVHSIMDVLLGDQDIAVIAGDILKAFDGNLFKIESDSMDTLELEYSEEILQQIHNCRQVSLGVWYFKGYKQNPGSANLAPFVEADAVSSAPAVDTMYYKQYEIDAFSDCPSPEEVVNCTALQCRVKWVMGGSGPYTVDVKDVTFDLFLPVQLDLYCDPTLAAPSYSFSKEYSDTYLVGTTWSGGGLRMLNFDWAPYQFIHVSAIPVSAGQGNLIAAGDVRMINFFDFNVHKRIHENSILSLFDLTEFIK